MSDSSPLTYHREPSCELDVGVCLHWKELEGSLRAFDLWYCESYKIAENIKVKAFLNGNVIVVSIVRISDTDFYLV